MLLIMFLFTQNNYLQEGPNEVSHSYYWFPNHANPDNR
jgi:hypothetical protein